MHLAADASLAAGMFFIPHAAGGVAALDARLRLQFNRTGSARARFFIDSWGRGIGQWRKVKPRGAQESVAAIRQLWTPRLQSLLETDGGAEAGRLARRASRRCYSRTVGRVSPVGTKFSATPLLQ